MNASEPGGFLTSNSYGKSGVKLLVPSKPGMREIEIDLSFSGEFEDVYLSGDNSAIIPSDSMRNHAILLANEAPIFDPADFGEALVGRIMDSMPAALKGTAILRSWLWVPDPHFASRTLLKQPSEVATVVIRDNTGATKFGGRFEGFLMNPSGSTFGGFMRDGATTQGEVSDRILAGHLDASWLYESKPADCIATNDLTRATLVEAFSKLPSRSVQETLYRMGETALGLVSDLSEVELEFQAVPIAKSDTSPFGEKIQNPTWSISSSPLGTSQATIRRTK